MEAAVQLPVMTARLDILGRVCESDEPSTVAAGGIGDIEILGDYVLTRQIARGMTGEVWLGLQMFLGELVRPVAIKRIDPVICTDPSLKRRFLREAAIMDRVRAPGIVPIYEIGMDRYHYFIASAFVQGETIADLLAASKRDRDPIPAAVAARIAADALAGLHALHIVENKKGRVLGAAHLDLCACSILVSYDGQVQLTDTGLGKHRPPSPYKARYRSPEQGRGIGTAKSDQFAIGVLLFEMLTGSVSPVISTDEERREILDALAPGIDRALRAIVLSALAGDPAQRFRSAFDMKHLLEGTIRQIVRDDPTANDSVELYMRQRFGRRLTEMRMMLSQAVEKSKAAVQAARRVETRQLDMVEIGSALEESSPSW